MGYKDTAQFTRAFPSNFFCHYVIHLE